MNDSFLVKGPEVSWRTLMIVAVLQIGVAICGNLYLVGWLLEIRRATLGWVDPTLLGSALAMIVVVGIGVLLIGRCSLVDVYWQRQKLPIALAVTAGIWAIAQVELAIAILVQGETPVMHSSWTDPGVGYVLAPLLGQVFGNALVEETLFRGFFFPQLLRKLRRRMVGRVMPAVLAVVASQAFFALCHVPNRIMKQVPLAEYGTNLLAVFVGGLIFVLIFVVSRNLWLGVGLHALWNRPTPLLEVSDGMATGVVVVLTLVLVAVWRPVERRFGRRLVNRSHG